MWYQRKNIQNSNANVRTKFKMQEIFLFHEIFFKFNMELKYNKNRHLLT